MKITVCALYKSVINICKTIIKFLIPITCLPEEKYNCNEKLILSAIAFLTLPETVIELNERLPPIEAPEYPPKRKFIEFTY